MANEYCTADDLLLGDMQLGAGVDLARYVTAAADEINSRLGYIYTIPLTAQSPATAVAPASLLVLKNINLKLASGRLIMAIASGGEDLAVNAYGLSLVQEAFAELQLVLSGSLPLVDAARLDSETGPATATTYNVDSVSPMEAFYTNFWGGSPLYEPFPAGGVWQPNDA